MYGFESVVFFHTSAGKWPPRWSKSTHLRMKRKSNFTFSMIGTKIYQNAYENHYTVEKTWNCGNFKFPHCHAGSLVPLPPSPDVGCLPGFRVKGQLVVLFSVPKSEEMLIWGTQMYQESIGFCKGYARFMIRWFGAPQSTKNLLDFARFRDSNHMDANCLWKRRNTILLINDSVYKWIIFDVLHFREALDHFVPDVNLDHSFKA